MRDQSKVSIIGAGAVGAACTFALAESGICSELVLVDIDLNKAEGEVMDISHGAAFMNSVRLEAGSMEKTCGSDIVIITAGAGQKPGETRLDLISKNARIFSDMIPKIVRYSPNAILLVVSNPVDILSYVTFRLSGLPSNRVIGSGTVLDSSRLRYALGKKFDIDAKSIHAHMVGEHGDSEFPLWSTMMIGSVPLEEYCEREHIDIEALKKEVTEEVRGSAYAIIQKKGYTNYAVALACRRIVSAILRDEKSILCISSYDPAAAAYYSVPTLVGRQGKILTICPQLSESEHEAISESRRILREVIESVDMDTSSI